MSDESYEEVCFGCFEHTEHTTVSLGLLCKGCIGYVKPFCKSCESKFKRVASSCLRCIMCAIVINVPRRTSEQHRMTHRDYEKFLFQQFLLSHVPDCPLPQTPSADDNKKLKHDARVYHARDVVLNDSDCEFSERDFEDVSESCYDNGNDYDCDFDEGW